MAVFEVCTIASSFVATILQNIKVIKGYRPLVMNYRKLRTETELKVETAAVLGSNVARYSLTVRLAT